jgi:hypothetical protein
MSLAAIQYQNKNAAYSTLAGGITNLATSLTVSSGQGARFPSSGSFICVIWGAAYTSPDQDPNHEYVIVGAVSTDTFSSITRAQENTSAQSWSNGDNIACVPSAAKMAELESNIKQLPVRDVSRNLKVYNDVTTPNTKVDVVADEVICQDSNGNSLKATSVNLVIDITASGANGLDTGSKANSTWYYIFVIMKADGTTAGLLSLSSTTPTMPTGYAYMGLVGAVMVNGSGNFITFSQKGKKVCSVVVLLVNAGTASTPTLVNLSTVPPTATAVYLKVVGASTSSNWAWADSVVYADSGGNFQMAEVGEEMSGASAAIEGTVIATVPLITAQSIWYKAVYGTCSLYALGWEY